eukprot:CAMPEP_0197321940 /NCGR_PEP_ID=MMETSP0891-20130614/67135_1 /TAXON_ID=44058 ORGANISM="Aureoumbra lagunensis, Strain CCMP1510" /NCGR_SAMPLE_ID=MMETSP0891 /ASSEMBLY_ACC=CAM_ASM_000534 /LENGTH=214 /DNA_ID=CAMNT_0042814059 /DNA_START=98 /DNA_END=742 /DNA_ORIENTATION=+
MTAQEWHAPDHNSVVDLAKSDLRKALAKANRGFPPVSKEINNEAKRALKKLIALHDDQVANNSIAGNWTLLWTDAPDILGLATSSGTPVSPIAPHLGRIGQEIDSDAKTIANVIEYKPPSWLPFKEDSIEQRVILGYEQQDDLVDLTLQGIGLRPIKLFGNSINRQLTTPKVTLPFGQFRILFNDGDLRVVQTQQGFFSVNERLRNDDETSSSS